MLGQINIQGTAEFAANEIICVCGHCGNHDGENATIELNFREMKILYSCSKCKKINEIQFGSPAPPPLPKIRVSR